MATSFELELDTTPPVFILDQVNDPYAGQTIVLEYSLNEPAIESAQLLPDGDPPIDLEIHPTYLSADLPLDMNTGSVPVEIHVKDEVDNEQTWMDEIFIDLLVLTPPNDLLRGIQLDVGSDAPILAINEPGAPRLDVDDPDNPGLTVEDSDNPKFGR